MFGSPDQLLTSSGHIKTQDQQGTVGGYLCGVDLHWSIFKTTQNIYFFFKWVDWNLVLTSVAFISDKVSTHLNISV